MLLIFSFFFLLFVLDSPDSRASPVHSAVLEKLDHFGPPVSALDFAVGYHPRTIIIRESNTHVQLEGTTTVDYCVLRLHQITPTLSSGK
jgi:hypothetical protein